MAWTADEAAYLGRVYRRMGRHHVASKLSKSPAAVWSMAKRLDLVFGELAGYLRASEVARLAQDSVGNIIKKADTAGVSRRLSSGPSGRPTAVLVPEGWAHELIEAYIEREHGEAKREAGWLTMSEVRRLWGVSKTSIMRGLQGRGFMAERLAKVRTATAKGGRNEGAWLFHPGEAQALAGELEAERRLAKSLISAKSIAIDLGYNRGVVASIGTQLGGRHLLQGGRLCCFLTQEQAAELRRRLHADLPEPPIGWVGVSDLAHELGVRPAQVRAWALAKKRRAPLKRFRHPVVNQPSLWLPEVWAEKYRRFRLERDVAANPETSGDLVGVAS